MEKHIERNLQRDIKHIVEMQSLLEEYDRENKYLNKQVLDLIGENTRLRMDKVKANIINDVLYSDKKKVKTPTKNTTAGLFQQEKERGHQSSKAEESGEKKMDEVIKKFQRSSSKKIMEKFKLDKGSETVKIDIIKKDEAVQTPVLDKTDQTVQTQPQLRQHNSPNKKEIEQKPFSFRHPMATPTDHPPFESQSASSKEFVSQIDVKFGESPYDTLKNQTSESRILAMSRQISQPNLQQGQSKDLIASNQQTLKRESTLTQLLKRSHAIKPSPQINASLCRNRQFMTPSSSEKKIGNREDSRNRLRPFESVEKKKRFIEIVSISHTPTKVAKGRGDDCC